METISIIVPVYNEEDTIKIFYDTCTKYLDNEHEFNIIFVDDGSKDKTLEICNDLSSKDKRIKYVSFSKNFGKEAAMYAGLEASKSLLSDAAIIMDVDLQDPPSLIPEFIKKHDEGFKLIYAKQKDKKKAKFLSRFFAKWFYRFYCHFTGDKQMTDGSRDFCLLDKKVIDAFLSIKDTNRFTKGLYHFVGFKTTTIEFEYQTRSAGVTKWSFKKLLKYGFSGIDEFSNWLLVVPKAVGFIWFIILIVDLVKQIVNNVNYGVFNTMPIRVDVAVISVALIGYIIVRLGYQILDESRRRPIYICEESNIETK